MKPGAKRVTDGSRMNMCLTVWRSTSGHSWRWIGLIPGSLASKVQGTKVELVETRSILVKNPPLRFEPSKSHSSHFSILLLKNGNIAVILLLKNGKYVMI